MAQQGGQQADDSMAPIWIMAIVFFGLFVIWFTAHAYIVRFVFSIDLFLARITQLAVDSPLLSQEIMMLQYTDPTQVTWQELMLHTTVIGSFIRYPLCVIVFVLAGVLYQSDVTRKYHTAHNMKTLRAQEQVNWPCIMPVVKLDLAKVDINTGPWAMALSPMEFARKYDLLKRDDPLIDGVVNGQEMTAGIRRLDAKRIFTMQLGAVWQDFSSCSPPAQALAAVFLARINRDRKSATMILETLDKTSVTGKPDYQVARATLDKYKDCEFALELSGKHAYVLTFLASLLQGSRDDGVVPSSEFLWLKTTDRRLWYMLNCVGRQTPYAEVAGPFAHWRAEQVMGRRALIPMIDEAIRALEIAVKEVKLSDKELAGLKP